MVLCFSMPSCGILQLVSYRLKKYIYFLSKISAWKGGFLFYFFFSSPMGMVPSVVHIAPVFLCSSLYFVWVRNEDWTVWGHVQSELYRCLCALWCVSLSYGSFIYFLLIVCLTMLTNVRLHSVEWCDNLCFGNDVEGVGRGLTWGIFLQRLRKRTEGL